MHWPSFVSTTGNTTFSGQKRRTCLSLLRQIISSTTPIPKALRDSYESPKSSGAKLTLSESEDATVEICEKVEAVYMVSDALDEVTEVAESNY